jgi:hypothetical protein
MVVVQQPLAGGAYTGPAVGGGGQLVVGVLQDPTGLLQPDQQRGAPAGALSGGEPLSGGDDLGPFRQVFGAEQLTANRAGEEVLAGIRLEERTEDGKGAARVERDDGSRCAMGFRLWAPGIRYMEEGESQAHSWRPRRRLGSSRSAYRR